MVRWLVIGTIFAFVVALWFPQSVVHATDNGFYGKGIYTSPDPNYAVGYGHGATVTFGCLATVGNVYKV